MSAGEQRPIQAIRGHQGRFGLSADARDLAELTPDERTSADLAGSLLETGNLKGLIQAVKTGEQSTETAREVLNTLVELDPDRLVQIALDTLIDEPL